MGRAMGIWGPVTASVDWCEANYVHTPYVAELFNTLSSLAMVLAGALGLILHARVLERRILVAFAALMGVGVGSVLFHATLRFGLQLADELPMVYLVLLIVDILYGPKPALRAGLILSAVGLTVLCVFTRGETESTVFRWGFSSFEVASLVGAAGLYRTGRDRERRALYRRGMVAYALGILAWSSELQLCPALSALPLNPQLHALWHVLVSAGFYALLTFIAAEQLARRGEFPEVAWVAGVLPRVTRQA